MEFCVLGGLALRDGDRVHTLGGPMQRALAAHLILADCRPVATADLVTRLWGATPPAGVRNALQVHVLRLRRVLAAAGCRAQIVSGVGSYMLDLAGDSVDAHRFARVVADASRAADDPHRVCALLEAVPDEWWRPLLDGVAGDWPRYPEARRLAELRVEAAERLAVARLAIDRPDAAAAALQDIAAEYPDRERLRYLLALALYRAGRRAEALAVYDQAYRFAVHELGLEPGEEMQQLQRAILRGDAVPVNAWSVSGQWFLGDGDLPDGVTASGKSGVSGRRRAVTPVRRAAAPHRVAPRTLQHAPRGGTCNAAKPAAGDRQRS